MLLGARLACVALLLLLSSVASARDVNVIVFGQSISANCNEFQFGAVGGVYQVSSNGDLRVAADPLETADCRGGSIWIPLANIMIERGFANKVVIHSLGVQGSSVMDWKRGGKAYLRTMDHKGRLSDKTVYDYALWLQGSSDIGMRRADYLSALNSVISSVNSEFLIKKWVIAIHSRCFGRRDDMVESAQNEVGSDFRYGKYHGPNVSSLSDFYRFDGCHLNRAGQLKLANMWFESILESDRLAQINDIETLMRFFR